MRRNTTRTMVMAAAVTSLLAASPQQPSSPALSEREKAIHLLDRIGFGARPGDVDRVLQLGVARYIDQQLHPERISDAAVEAKLQRYTTLRLSAKEIGDQFAKPGLEARKERKARQKEQAAKGDSSAAMDDEADSRKEVRAALPPQQRGRRLVEELTAARLVRATDSERQLNEVMVDFWMNHFNVYAGKGVDRFLLTTYERDTVRPHIWGKFEDLLMATAKSPAMLFYLDNARSVANQENRPAQQRGALTMRRRGGFGDGRREEMLGTLKAPKGQGKQGGLNENYAREIMELHTLGVDGGYSQQDVTELARVFTGWSIERPENGASFVFRSRMHDANAKTVLGVHFAAGGGMEEGERMIHILAHHPATAHHIAYQLCQRLIADEPPAAVVDRVAKKFLATDGDLRQTVAAVINSPEFFDPQYYRAKVKSPFEYVVSTLRATDAQVSDPLPVARTLRQMGEGLYDAQPPTGYSDVASAWINSGALLARLNFALSLATSKLPGVDANVQRMIAPQDANDPQRTVDAFARLLTGGALTTATRSTITQRLDDPKEGMTWDGKKIETVAGLILGSPEFQKQ